MKLHYISTFSIFAFALATLLSSNGCTKKAPVSQSHAVSVTLAKAEERTFQNRIHVQGIIQPVEKATLGARVEGTMDILSVKEGDQVKKGDLLFQIDKLNLENRLKLAEHEVTLAQESVQVMESDLEISKRDMEKTKLDYDRASTLRKEEVLSVDAYEKADVSLRKATLAVQRGERMLAYLNSKLEQQQANLLISQKNLSDSKGIAPFDGVITHKFKEQGEYPGGSSRSPILRMENPDLLELSCLLSAVHYTSILPGKTEVLIHCGEQTLSATITYRSPSIDEKSRTFEIKAALPPKTPIASGLLCEVDIVLSERKGYGLPSGAVMLRSQNKYIVYYSQEGKAISFEVEPGLTTDGFTEIRNISEMLDKEFVISGQYFTDPGDTLNPLQ